MGDFGRYFSYVTFSRGPIGNIGNLHSWLWGAEVGKEKIRFIEPVKFIETLESKGGYVQNKDMQWFGRLCLSFLNRPYSPIYNEIIFEGEDCVSKVKINGIYQDKEFHISLNPKTWAISCIDTTELSNSELQEIVRRLNVKELIVKENEKREKEKCEKEKMQQEREKEHEKRQIENMLRIWNEMI